MYFSPRSHHVWTNAISDHHVGGSTLYEMNNFLFTIFINDFKGHLDVGVPEFDGINNAVKGNLRFEIVNSKGMVRVSLADQ